MAMPDQWTEIAYVAISDEDGNEYQFGSITDTIDISWGSRDIESIPTVSAGRVTRYVPEDLSEITLELFPVGISSDGAIPNGVHAWFAGLSPSDTSGLVQFKRKKFRVSVLWTTVSPITNAAGAIGSGESLRFSWWNCYMTDATLSFTDELLRATVTFKCPPYDRAANSLIKMEEVDESTLSSLGTYAGVAPSP
jgi:hypothetical protein